MGNGGGVCGGFARSEVESFEAAMGKPAVEWGRDSTYGVLQEGETGVKGGRVEGCGPHEDILVGHISKRSRIGTKNRNEKAYGMAIDVFRDGVNHDIRAMVERVLHIGAQKGVVNHDHDPMTMRHRGYFADIHQAQGGIARTLDPDQFRLIRPNQFGNVDLNAGGKCYLHAMRRGDFGEVAVRAAIDVGDGDNVRALGQRL